MKIRRNKKGFTIVELVIVIAVIGILTAILIPTFVNLTKKANKASDQSLVTNLNTALRMAEGDNEIVDGHKLSNENVTMHDAVLDLDAYGYGLTKLVTKSSEDLLYSLKENKFYLSNDKDIDKNYKTAKEKVQYLWTIQNSVTGSEQYSVYAGAQWSQAAISELHVGFDAGVRTDISSISYSNNSQQNVVIRTNSFDTTLTVNAASDTVKHYGEVGSLNIIAVANASYHEFGTISQKAQIAEGRLVVESTGNIPLVEITAVPTEQAPVKVETSKDIVVTVSDEVADSLGENKLPNTEIKVSDEQANVIVDAVVEASSVEINGTPATTEDLELVYKAYTAAEIEEAPAGSYVMLMKDLHTEDLPYQVMDFGFMVINNPTYIELRNKTLDLNGHTIENDKNGRYRVLDVGGNVEILDSSSDKSGEVINTSEPGTIDPSHLIYANSNSTLTISGGTFTSTQDRVIYFKDNTNTNIIINGGTISSYSYAIELWPANNCHVSLTINGGTITSQTEYAITGNGMHHGTEININGGEISSPKTAIYHPQDGVLNITGGTIYGESAVEMRAGTLTVSGNAVLRGNGSYSCEANGNGHTTTGVALAIAQHTTLKDINVTINGGKFEGAKAVAINNPQENDTTNVTVTINGGTFSGGIYKNPDNASAWTLTDNR